MVVTELRAPLWDALFMFPVSNPMPHHQLCYGRYTRPPSSALYPQFLTEAQRANTSEPLPTRFAWVENCKSLLANKPKITTGFAFLFLRLVRQQQIIVAAQTYTAAVAALVSTQVKVTITTTIGDH